MDCDHVDGGCSGGWMADAYTWTSKNGIVYDHNYHNYVGHVSRCRSRNDSVKWYNAGSMEEDYIDNMRIKSIVSK